jgi:glycosyltransferase involved in cell wall biosynthesis
MVKASICMLAHNTGRFIEKAIESALAQKTNFKFELVIAEDKSTDNTREIAEKYKLKYPDKIKLILNEKNLGLSGNYIVAFKNCSAEYIAVLDTDDYWCDEYKLQKQVDFLEQNRDYGLVYSDCKVINDAGEETEWDEIKYIREQFSSGNLFFKLLKEAAFIPTLTTCFRKELITDALENEDLWFFEDWWLWMRVALKSKVYYMDEQTACYRLHPNNITKTRVENKKKQRQYKRKAYSIFYSNIFYFHGFNKAKLEPSEREILLRKILMLLYRPQGTLKMKLKLLPLAVKYFTGLGAIPRLLSHKMKKKAMPHHR